MISPFKLANAPENVALRALGIHAAELDALARAHKIKVFRSRGGGVRYDALGYLAHQARVLGPRRDRSAKAPRAR
jgi:hypothetical protein